MVIAGLIVGWDTVGILDCAWRWFQRRYVKCHDHRIEQSQDRWPRLFLVYCFIVDRRAQIHDKLRKSPAMGYIPDRPFERDFSMETEFFQQTGRRSCQHA